MEFDELELDELESDELELEEFELEEPDGPLYELLEECLKQAQKKYAEHTINATRRVRVIITNPLRQGPRGDR